MSLMLKEAREAAAIVARQDVSNAIALAEEFESGAAARRGHGRARYLRPRARLSRLPADAHPWHGGGVAAAVAEQRAANTVAGAGLPRAGGGRSRAVRRM